ncbi:MAG: winged helix-turn-helix transcriptional regulator [Thermoplasmata archaeon]
MNKPETTRESIINTVKNNPGLHFRELQRRTGLAVGQLEYHLYQLQKDSRITTRQDGKLVRYFSNESGNAEERSISYHLRGRLSRELIIDLLKKNERTLTERNKNDEKFMRIIETMKKDGLIEKSDDNGVTTIRLRNRQALLAFLNKYRASFLDSLAYTMLDLFETK